MSKSNTMLIPKSEATAVFSGIIDPVVSEFGFHVTRYGGAKRSSPPVRWQKKVDDFILIVHLQRGKTGRSYFVNLNLYLDGKKAAKASRSTYAILLGRLEELLTEVSARRISHALDTEEGLSRDERKEIISTALREHGLPTLEATANRDRVTEAYLCGVMLLEAKRFGILQPHARQFFEPVNGIYLHIFDLPTLADPSIRMTDDCLRRGQTSILVIWSVDDTACRQSHSWIVRLAKSIEIDIFGLADRASADSVAAFLKAHQDPYHICALDIDGNGTRSPDGRLPIDWRRVELPVLMVVDRNGVVRNQHFGAITEKVIGEILRWVTEANAPYEYIPKRARPNQRQNCSNS